MTVTRSLLPLLTGLSVVIGAFPGAAQVDDGDYPKRIPYERVEIVFHRMPAPSGLQALLAELRERARARQPDAIMQRVADDFFLERDFGATLKPGQSGAGLFTAKLRIDPERTPKDEIDDGWAELGRLLDRKEFGPAAEHDGVLCTSPLADFRDEARAEEVFEALMADYLFDTMYAEGVAPVHAAADARSPVIGRIENEAVLVLDRTYDDADMATHYEVLLPDGRSAHVRAGMLGSFMDARLCFAPDATGTWSIAGHIGGKGI